MTKRWTHIMPQEWTGEELRRLRKTHGMSQSEFGQVLFPDAKRRSAKEYVGKMERGQRSISVDTRMKLDYIRDSGLPFWAN